MIENLDSKNNKSSHLGVLAIVAVIVYLIANILGEAEFGGSLALNQTCYKYLGCTSGFGGYDAIEHLLFGIACTLVLIWFFRKYQKFSLLSDKHWKNFLLIISIIIFIGVAWELLEFVHDTVRVDIFHQALINWKLHIDYLDQPTNADTMGDLFFGFIGSAITLLFTRP